MFLCAVFVCANRFGIPAPVLKGGRASFFFRSFPRVSGISVQKNVLPIRCEIAHAAAAPVFFGSAPVFFSHYFLRVAGIIVNHMFSQYGAKLRNMHLRKFGGGAASCMCRDCRPRNGGQRLTSTGMALTTNQGHSTTLGWETATCYPAGHKTHTEGHCHWPLWEGANHKTGTLKPTPGGRAPTTVRKTIQGRCYDCANHSTRNHPFQGANHPATKPLQRNPANGPHLGGRQTLTGDPETDPRWEGTNLSTKNHASKVLPACQPATKLEYL